MNWHRIVGWTCFSVAIAAVILATLNAKQGNLAGFLTDAVFFAINAVLCVFNLHRAERV